MNDLLTRKETMDRFPIALVKERNRTNQMCTVIELMAQYAIVISIFLSAQFSLWNCLLQRTPLENNSEIFYPKPSSIWIW